MAGLMRGLPRLCQRLAAIRLVDRSSSLHTAASFTGIWRVPSHRGEFFATHISGLAPASKLFQAAPAWYGVKHMSSDISNLPDPSDPQAKKALNALFATDWIRLEKEVVNEVEAALAKKTDDILSTVWSSAKASERFAEKLISLRDELDELSGAQGEAVKKIPDGLIRALESALGKYTTYLAAFSEDEGFLRKKVENDLGSILVQIKQRCSGLDPKWAKVTLLGTSGLSGSYIERRASS